MNIPSHSNFASVLVCVFGLGIGMPALAAATYVWTGGAGDNDWTNPKNYEPEATPAAGDIVKVPDGAKVIEAEYEENLFTSKKVVFRYSA